MSSKIVRDREGGFTLMESIVAFVIFSMVFFAIYQGFAGSWRGVRLAQTEISALELCRAKLAAAGFETPLSDGYDEAASDGGFQWHVSMEKYVIPGQDAQPGEQAAYWVTVEVTWRERSFSGVRKIQLQALKLART